MRNQCIFYLAGGERLCELLEATRRRSLSEAQRIYLESSYCNSEQHQRCPVLRQFARSLAKAELCLEYPLVA
ncbi:MAG: hypothetical protein JXA30_19295 [Deltaproteobacteria bacterium]|nr:hypothetical protein [Deltaproteobacteria bacterium]